MTYIPSAGRDESRACPRRKHPENLPHGKRFSVGHAEHNGQNDGPCIVDGLGNLGREETVSLKENKVVYRNDRTGDNGSGSVRAPEGVELSPQRRDGENQSEDQPAHCHGYGYHLQGRHGRQGKLESRGNGRPGKNCQRGEEERPVGIGHAAPRRKCFSCGATGEKNEQEKKKDVSDRKMRILC